MLLDANLLLYAVHKQREEHQPDPAPGMRGSSASSSPPTTSGNLVPDALLAALAIEHGLTLCSTDTDFARFRDLRWENPLY